MLSDSIIARAKRPRDEFASYLGESCPGVGLSRDATNLAASGRGSGAQLKGTVNGARWTEDVTRK